MANPKLYLVKRNTATVALNATTNAYIGTYYDGTVMMGALDAAGSYVVGTIYDGAMGVIVSNAKIAASTLNLIGICNAYTEVHLFNEFAAERKFKIDPQYLLKVPGTQDAYVEVGTAMEPVEHSIIRVGTGQFYLKTVKSVGGVRTNTEQPLLYLKTDGHYLFALDITDILIHDTVNYG